MLGLFGGAILAAALLLFLVQPMAAKIVLPKLGGSPSVWIGSMLFFQAALLAGYFYTHTLTTRLRLQVQIAIHAILLLAAAFSLPPPTDMQPPSGQDPMLWLLQTLAITVGLPFFVIATTSPLLQRWFSYTGHPSAKDPYFLYAASNIGNIAGLLSYPLLLEPFFGLRKQTWIFSAGFGLMLLLVLAAGAVALRRAGGMAGGATPATDEITPKERITWKQRANWTLLSFVPSSLLLGVTLHITTDVGSLPLLWAAPLLLYLLSFVLAFSPRVKVAARTIGLAMLCLMLGVALTMLDSGLLPSWLTMAVHTLTFGACAWMCHKLLASARPGPSGLTDFYLWLSVGGVLGGLFNALLAPRLFTFVAEYPIVLALAVILIPTKVVSTLTQDSVAKASRTILEWKPIVISLACALVMVGLFLAIDDHIITNARSKAPSITNSQVSILRVLPAMGLLCACLLWLGPRRSAIVFLSLMLSTQLIVGRTGILHRERTFFGVHRVLESPRGSWRTLVHGTTTHGIQQWKPEKERLIPRGYYSEVGPAGDVFVSLIEQSRLKDVALVGMGTGAFACYGEPGMTMTFFEIDPAVIHIAGDKNYFTYIYQSQAKVGYVEGDGRITVAEQPENSYDLIVLDAFSSDAIPTHLLTQEAVQSAYLPRLRQRGLLLFHISNNFFDLSGPLARIAQSLDLTVLMRDDPGLADDVEQRTGYLGGTWVVMARDPADAEHLLKVPGWALLSVPAGQKLWTDDEANLLSVMRFRK